MAASIPKRRRAAFAFTVLLVVANLFVLNWIARDHFARLDVTSTKAFTLHPATIDLLEGLDDLVTVRAFVSERAFRDQPQYATWPRMLRDLLEEFVAAGRGQVRLEVKDPTDDPDVAREARTAGVREVQLQGRDDQSAVVFKAYAGLVLSYGGRPDEVLPFVFPVEQLEYGLALSMSRLVRKRTVTIGFNSLREAPKGLALRYAGAAGMDENDIDRNWRLIRQALERQFDIEKVPMDREVPAHVDLLVVHNVSGMDEKAQFYLDQYLMSGGKLLVLADGTQENAQLKALTARNNVPDALFAHYGFEIARNIVFDRQAYQPDPRLPPRYWFPKLLSRYFDPESSLLNGIDEFHLMLPSSIRLNPPEGVEAVVLAKTTPSAWSQEGFFDVRRDMTPPENLDEYGQFDMVGLLEGEFTSYFANRALPEGVETSSRGPTREEFEKAGFEVEDADDGADEERDDEPDEPSPSGGGGTGGGTQIAPMFVQARSPATKIVVIGNTRFLAEGAPQQFPGNLLFLWALVDRLTTGSSLTDIRNRSLAPPSIRADLTPGARAAVRYGGMLGVPALVLLLGLGSVVWRRARRGA